MREARRRNRRRKGRREGPSRRHWRSRGGGILTPARKSGDLGKAPGKTRGAYLMSWESAATWGGRETLKIRQEVELKRTPQSVSSPWVNIWTAINTLRTQECLSKNASRDALEQNKKPTHTIWPDATPRKLAKWLKCKRGKTPLWSNRVRQIHGKQCGCLI